jgi:hypothetical protein
MFVSTKQDVPNHSHNADVRVLGSYAGLVLHRTLGWDQEGVQWLQWWDVEGHLLLSAAEQNQIKERSSVERATTGESGIDRRIRRKLVRSCLAKAQALGLDDRSFDSHGDFRY